MGWRGGSHREHHVDEPAHVPTTHDLFYGRPVPLVRLACWRWVQQRCDRYLKGARQPFQSIKARVAAAALQRADVGAVHAARFRQIFLTPSPQETPPAYVLRQKSSGGGYRLGVHLPIIWYLP